MARGSWDDFTSKYGFNDGASTEERDWRVRDILVRMLNERQEMTDAGVRAEAYDRPGLHNGCLIVLVKTSADADGEAATLPDLDVEINALVNEAYDSEDSRQVLV